MLLQWTSLSILLWTARISSSHRYYQFDFPSMYLHHPQHDVFAHAHRRVVRSAEGDASINRVPDSLDQLMEMQSDKPKILAFGPGCNLMLQKVMSITVLSVEKCPSGIPSLKAVLEYFKVSDVGSVDDLLEPEQYEFTQLDIQNSDNKVTFKGKAKQAIDMLEGFIILDSGASLRFSFPSLINGFPLDELEIAWAGRCKIYDKTGTVSINRLIKNPYYTVDMTLPTLTVFDLVEHFSIDYDSLVAPDIDFDTDRLADLEFRDPVLKGEIAPNDFQLVCKGTVGNDDLLGGADILGVISRDEGESPMGAVMIKTKGDHDLVEILDAYTSVNIPSDMTILGQLDRQALIIVSQDVIEKVESSQLKRFWKQMSIKLDGHDSDIPEGVHFQLQAHIPQETGTDIKQRSGNLNSVLTDLQLGTDGLAINFADAFQSQAERGFLEFFNHVPSYIKEFMDKIRRLSDTVHEYIEIKEFKIGDLPKRNRSSSQTESSESGDGSSGAGRGPRGTSSQFSGGEKLAEPKHAPIKKIRRPRDVDDQEDFKRSVQSGGRSSRGGQGGRGTGGSSGSRGGGSSGSGGGGSSGSGGGGSSDSGGGGSSGSGASSTVETSESATNESESAETPKKPSVLRFHIKKRIQLFEGPKIFSVPQLEVYIKYLEGNWTFSAEANFTFDSQTVPITIAYDAGVYTFKIAFDRLNLSDIVRVLVAPRWSNPAEFIPGLDQIAIKNFQFVGKFGDTFRLRIAGTPTFFGFDKVHLEGYIWTKEDGSKAMAFGVVLQAIRLDELLESIFGAPVLPASFLSELNGYLVISDTKANGEQKVDEGVASGEGNSTNSTSGGASSGELPEESPGGSSGGSSSSTSSSNGGSSPSRGRNSGRNPRKLKAKKSKNSAKQERVTRSTNEEVNEEEEDNVETKTTVQTNAQRHKEQNLRRRRRRRRPTPARNPSESDTTPPTAAATNQTNNATAEEEEEEKEKEEEEKEEEVDEDMKFHLKDLVGKDIEKGVQFEAKFTVPKTKQECKADNLCAFMQEKMNSNDVIKIKGIFKPTEFELSGEVNMERNITANFRFISASLELKYSGKESSISLKCKLGYNNGQGIDLIFEGAISAKVTGEVSLQFAMTGNWPKPFGFKYLIIKKILLGIGYTPGAPLPSLEFGADIYIGDVDAVAVNNLIHLVGFFGFDPVNPSNNYVYASGSHLTLAGVATAFQLDVEFPELIKDTGFPDEVVFSFSMTGKTIDSIGVTVKQGVYFNGTFNFLGYEVKAVINIVVKKPEEMTSGGWPFQKFVVDIDMSPFNISSGLIALQRSETESTKGPKAFINFEAGKIPNIHIEGYITVLGISSYTQIKLSDTEFSLAVEGSVFGILQTSLNIQASYGSIAKMSFQFQGCVTIDMRTIAQIVEDFLQRAANGANEARLAAESKLDDALGFLTLARAGLNVWNQTIIAKRNELTERCRALEEKKRKLEQQRCQDQCGKVCIPFLDWNPKCWKIWYWWVGCPKWNSCRWEVDDPICMASCEISKAVNKMSLWAEKLGIKIMIGFTHFGEALLSAGGTLLTGAEKLVEFARTVVQTVNRIVQIGLQVVNAIAQSALNSVVIERFCIGGSLDAKFDACVNVTLKASIFGHDIDYKGKKCLNLNFFKSVGSQAAETRYPGLQKMNEDLEEVNGKIAEVSSSKEELSKEKSKIDIDVADETKAARSYIPSSPTVMNKQDMWFRQVAEMSVPQIPTKRADIIKRFEDASLESLVRNYDPSQAPKIAPLRDNIEAPADLFKEENITGPCHEVRSVIKKYSHFQDGLRGLSLSLSDQKRMFIAARDSMRRSIEAINDQVTTALRTYNATDEEREGLVFWRDKAKDDVESWIQATTRALKAQRRTAIADFRTQLDSVFKEKKNTDVKSYIKKLHENASNAMKRTTLPTAATTQAENGLLGIKRSLVNLFGDKTIKTKGFSNVVDNLSEQIGKTRSYVQEC